VTCSKNPNNSFGENRHFIFQLCCKLPVKCVSFRSLRTGRESKMRTCECKWRRYTIDTFGYQDSTGRWFLETSFTESGAHNTYFFFTWPQFFAPCSREGTRSKQFDIHIAHD